MKLCASLVAGLFVYLSDGGGSVDHTGAKGEGPCGRDLVAFVLDDLHLFHAVSSVHAADVDFHGGLADVSVGVTQ